MSDNIFEETRDVTLAKAVWKIVLHIFQRYTLVKKVKDRRNFYKVTPEPSENILSFTCRVGQLESVWKSVSVDVNDAGAAMTILNGLYDEFG